MTNDRYLEVARKINPIGGPSAATPEVVAENLRSRADEYQGLFAALTALADQGYQIDPADLEGVTQFTDELMEAATEWGIDLDRLAILLGRETENECGELMWARATRDHLNILSGSSAATYLFVAASLYPDQLNIFMTTPA